MIHFTDGTRQPYWIEAPAIRHLPPQPLDPARGVKPTSFIRTKATTNITTSTTARTTKGTPRFVTWAM